MIIQSPLKQWPLKNADHYLFVKLLIMLLSSSCMPDILSVNSISQLFTKNMSGIVLDVENEKRNKSISSLKRFRDRGGKQTCKPLIII